MSQICFIGKTKINILKIFPDNELNLLMYNGLINHNNIHNLLFYLYKDKYACDILTSPRGKKYFEWYVFKEHKWKQGNFYFINDLSKHKKICMEK